MTNQRRIAVAIAVVAAFTLLSAALVPMEAESRPANQIPIEAVSDGSTYESPTASEWDEVTKVTVPMTAAPSGLPNAADTSVDQATVRVVHDDDRVYARVAWDDATVDDEITDSRTFADGVALQFPTNTSERPAIAMGSSRSTVNVWYWDAAEGTEELLAGGQGSTTAFEDPMVETSVEHQDGRWQVVFARSLTADSPDRTSIEMDSNVDVAVAAWNGSNMERAGHKSTTEWYHLPFGPGPSGTPFESILWGIAGIAVVIVIAVTVMAVRGRGE